MTLGASSGHDGRVEDWVAVEVRSGSGVSGYFVTWGRIQHAVDPRPLEELMLRAAHRFATDVRRRERANAMEEGKEIYFLGLVSK